MSEVKRRITDDDIQRITISALARCLHNLEVDYDSLQIAHEYACEVVKRAHEQLDERKAAHQTQYPDEPADLTQRISAALASHAIYDTGLTGSLTDLFRKLWKEAADPN